MAANGRSHATSDQVSGMLAAVGEHVFASQRLRNVEACSPMVASTLLWRWWKQSGDRWKNPRSPVRARSDLHLCRWERFAGTLRVRGAAVVGPHPAVQRSRVAVASMGVPLYRPPSFQRIGSRKRILPYRYNAENVPFAP